MKIKPLRDNILLEPIKEERKKGGIILPETVEKDRPEKGRVLAVGPGKFDQHGKRIPLEVKKGNVVLFTKYGPNEIKVDDKKTGKEVEYLIAKEEDILAILE
ncbi:MAG: co-chaperone GroES [Parcubacteria group bacterium]|nr:co-chaperone GroES [Parcubacteria group bacterium]